MFDKPIIKAFTHFLVVTGLIMLFSITFHPVEAQENVETLLVGETLRSYQIHLPDNTADDASLPLLIALHPTASSAEAMAILTGLNDAADAENFIVAYPNNNGFSWFDGRDLSDLNLPAVDDIAFISEMIDHLIDTYPVDAERIYLTGFGNGGMMAYRLACELPERFAGVAVVGPLLWQHHRRACPQEASAPVNLLIIHGSADTLYPVEGKTLDTEVILGVDQTLAFWATRNGCENAETRDNIQRYSDCAENTTLTYYQVAGASQNWPRIGDYLLNQFDVDATTMIADFISQPDTWPSAQGDDAISDRLARSFTLYVPDTYNPDEAAPLVILLHGRTGTGAGMAYITDMNLLAEREGFITVYPDGINNEWNYARGIPGYPEREHDDTLFLSNLITDLSVDLNIDQERIYVTGFSNGGFMTERLACEMPEQYAAFGVVSATGYLGITRDCEDTPSVPLLFIHGTEDISVPWDGLSQQSGQRSFYLTLPVQLTLEFWLIHNGCEPDYDQTTLPPSGESPATSVEWLDFTGCTTGAEISFYGVIGGGHNWPGVPGRVPDFIAGEVTMDINASEVIWDFFTHYTRNIAS